MPQRSVATNFTFEQQRQEINLLAADFWTQKGDTDTALPTFLKHDGSNAFTGQTLNVPNAFTISPNSGNGTLTISGNLDVTGTTTTVNTTNLEVTDKNILIAKGSTSDAQADGAGITIDSATDITFNFVDAKDALVSSIGLEATTFIKSTRAQFTGAGNPTTGQGLELTAPDQNTGQIASYDRDTPAYKELRLKGSTVSLYGGTTNALVGTFNSTGLDVVGNIDSTISGGDNNLKIETTTSGDPSLSLNASGSGGHTIEYIRSTNTLNFKQGGGSVRMSIAADGTVDIARNLNANLGLDVTGDTSISGKTTIGTTTTNASDSFTIMDPGNVFMSIRSDSIALGNYQILDFATGAADRASSNMTGSIAAEIMQESPLKSDLCFSTNKGDSISQSLKLRSSGTLESFVPSDATPNFKFRSDDVNWHGYLNQTVEGSSITTTLSCAGSWTVNGSTYDATKDYNGSFGTLALAIHNQYNGGAGGFVFLNKAGGSTTTDGAVSELLRIDTNGNIETKQKEITGGTQLAIQNFKVKGKWSGGGSIGKEIEMLSGYDSDVKMAAIGYNLTDTSSTSGGTYGGDLVFHSQPLYSTPTVPLPERLRITSHGTLFVSKKDGTDSAPSNPASGANGAGTGVINFVGSEIGGTVVASVADESISVAIRAPRRGCFAVITAYSNPSSTSDAYPQPNTSCIAYIDVGPSKNIQILSLGTVGTAVVSKWPYDSDYTNSDDNKMTIMAGQDDGYFHLVNRESNSSYRYKITFL